MLSREQAISEYIRAYPMEVPRERVEEEYRLCLLDMQHKMVYGQMSGAHHMNAIEQTQAIHDSMEELMEVAYWTVKEELVMEELLKREDFAVTAQELQVYAKELAQRQKTTLDMVKHFFGEDFKLLERDVRRQKAENWICTQMYEGEAPIGR